MSSRLGLSHRLNRALWSSSRYLHRVEKRKNYYDVLGLTPKATQKEVKEAYYKLSKMLHPDMTANDKDSAEKSEKFRQVSDAYEVLGNYKSRRMYDKGMLGSAAGLHPVPQDQPVEEDDATTKFYKSRFHRSKAPTVSDRQIWPF
jgi:DnaJ family protein C protein 30